MALGAVTGYAPPLAGLKLCREVGTAGSSDLCPESHVFVGLGPRMGNDVDTNRLVIHLGHCDEHSAAGKKRHEFNEHRTSFVAQVIVFTSAICVLN